MKASNTTVEENEEINDRSVLTTKLLEGVFRQYKDCRQGTRIVNEYMEEFDKLVSRNDLEEIKDQQISKFVH